MPPDPNPRIALYETDHATVAVDGTATVRLRPDGARETWHPDTVHAIATTDTLEAICRVYAGPKAADQYFVDATATGSLGDSTDRISGHRIGRHFDDSIIGVWSGADPGAQVTLKAVGTKTVG